MVYSKLNLLYMLVFNETCIVVPLSSILGLLLFCIYLHPVKQQIQGYADNIQIYFDVDRWALCQR